LSALDKCLPAAHDEDTGIKITWLGNASIRITIAGLTLLFDPFIPLPGAEYSLTAEELQPAQHVLVTHGHFDHAVSVPETIAAETKAVYLSQSPQKALQSAGVPVSLLVPVQPGDMLDFSTTSGALETKGPPVEVQDAKSNARVAVLRGKHIRFDLKLVVSTSFNLKVLQHRVNIQRILRDHKLFREHDETLVFVVFHVDKTIVVLGSLALDDAEAYPESCDLLVLPFQGHTRLEAKALAIIERLKPKAIMLDHFDDAFPPVSRHIETSGLVQAVAEQYPHVKTIVPQRGEAFIL